MPLQSTKVYNSTTIVFIPNNFTQNSCLRKANSNNQPATTVQVLMHTDKCTRYNNNESNLCNHYASLLILVVPFDTDSSSLMLYPPNNFDQVFPKVRSPKIKLWLN